MSKGNNTPGIGRLAGAIRMIARGTGEEPYTVDFGSIGADHSLMCDALDDPIPKGDYQICRSVTIAHDNARKIRAGDRVLVVMVDDEAVVIDILVEASAAFS